MFKKTEKVVKSESKTITSDGETTTIVTETIMTADGGTKTVQKTVTERSQNFSTNLKAFQDMSLAGQDRPALTNYTSAKKAEPEPTRKETPETSATSAPPPSASLDGKMTFQEDALKWHNYYRQKHGVAPLKLSPTLCAYAKEWAEKIAKTNNFQHRPNNKYGENLYMKGTSNANYQVTGKEAVESWYSEIKDHTFGVEPRSMGTGHFTQVVWKSSTEMGIASAKASGGRHYVVANYNPAGNFLGKYAENVPPPK